MGTNTPKDEDKQTNTRSVPSETGTARSIALPDNRIDSRDLFVNTREITIAHGTETYRLRLTALNKLILTK